MHMCTTRTASAACCAVVCLLHTQKSTNDMLRVHQGTWWPACGGTRGFVWRPCSTASLALGILVCLSVVCHVCCYCLLLLLQAAAWCGALLRNMDAVDRTALQGVAVVRAKLAGEGHRQLLPSAPVLTCADSTIRPGVTAQH